MRFVSCEQFLLHDLLCEGVLKCNRDKKSYSLDKAGGPIFK